MKSEAGSLPKVPPNKDSKTLVLVEYWRNGKSIVWSGNLVPGSGFAFIINWGHSLIGGADYSNTLKTDKLV